MRGIIFMSPEPWQAEPSRRLRTFIMRLHDPVPLRHLCLTDLLPRAWHSVDLQRSAKRLVRGCEKFLPALA